MFGLVSELAYLRRYHSFALGDEIGIDSYLGEITRYDVLTVDYELTDHIIDCVTICHGAIISGYLPEYISGDEYCRLTVGYSAYHIANLNHLGTISCREYARGLDIIKVDDDINVNLIQLLGILLDNRERGVG